MSIDVMSSTWLFRKLRQVGEGTLGQVGRPPNEARRYANFTYWAASWSKPRGFPKLSGIPENSIRAFAFIVTNMSRPASGSCYNKRGTCEQWIKEGKGAIEWRRLSCRTFATNAVRLQAQALTYNLGNFLRRRSRSKIGR